MKASAVASDVDMPLPLEPDQPAAAPRGSASTPRWLGLWLSALVLLALAAGLAGGYQVEQRTALVDDVALRSGALSTTELELYQSLSDADATAASAFLAGGLEPPEQRRRYENAIARASAALATAADGAPSEQNDTITELSVNLPVYTGLVERARAYNRQGLPLGAAYLRQASGLMRETLLPAARRLHQDEARRLSVAQASADSGLWPAVILVLILLASLGFAQRGLALRVNRVLNAGLVAAAAATLVAGIWLTAASVSSASHVDASRRDGSGQLAVLAEARIAALQARSDEAMTLIARGSGAEFDEHFDAEMKRLTGPAGDGGLLGRARERATEGEVRKAVDAAIRAARQWRAAHGEVRRLDRAGDHNQAVRRAIGGDPGSAGSLASRLDEHLGAAIDHASARFDEEARRARTSLYGAGYALTFLMAVAAAGAAFGLQRRLREYW